MPPDTKEERAPTGVFLIVGLAEYVYRRAEKVAALFSRPALWPVILLFLPKINLISSRNETAGIRFDDFLLLTVATFLLAGWIAKLDFTVDQLAAVGLGVAGVFCVSNLINAGHSSFLYSLRLVEYLVFFWSGKYIVRSHHDFTFLVKLLIGINCAFILLQFGGVVGGFTADGYMSTIERPFGLSANHPAEMGAVLNLLFAALVFGSRPVKFWYWSGLIGLCIFVTESRSALLAHCLLTFLYIYRHSTNRAILVLRTTALAGLLTVVLVVIPNSASKRSTDLLSWQNIETFKTLYDKLPGDTEFTGFAEGGAPEDAPEGVDTSWYMRGFKWAQVVKIMLTAPWTVWIFGLGPGALGPALDGGWLRLISETGVVGTVAFLFLMRRIWMLSPSCAMAVVALAVNMLMVDSQNAYKVMAFLFFLVGAEAQRRFKETRVMVSHAELPRHT